MTTESASPGLFLRKIGYGCRVSGERRPHPTIAELRPYHCYNQPRSHRRHLEPIVGNLSALPRVAKLSSLFSELDHQLCHQVHNKYDKVES